MKKLGLDQGHSHSNAQVCRWQEKEKKKRELKLNLNYPDLNPWTMFPGMLLLFFVNQNIIFYEVSDVACIEELKMINY